MIPRLVSEGDIVDISTAVCRSIEDTIKVFDVRRKADDRVHPHFVIEGIKYWRASGFVAAVKREVDSVLKYKIAALEADASK